MIKYLGSKRKLVDTLYRTISEHSSGGTILDAFSGTGRVSYALKSLGCPVVANDHNTYAATIAKCYVEADTTYARQASLIINELNSLPPSPGYFTETFCERSRFIQPKNGARIDAMREEIERKELPDVLKSVVLTSLIEAADRVDSTVGLQMAYLKQWAKRSYNDIQLRLPELIDGHVACSALQMEAEKVVQRIEADVLYLDPPYNQHSYLGNYHVWESLALWDKPEVYGVACKRVDVKTRKSPFNSKRKCADALKKVVEKSKFNTLIMSYNNEGHLKIEEIVNFMTLFGEVKVLDIDYKRHVCSQIGVFNKQGVKVGVEGEKANKEHIIICKRNEN